MANIKISQLPAASVVTANSDVLPIVHSGATQKVTPDLLVKTVLSAPGPIGGGAAGSGSFTSLTATGAVTLSPNNANVAISPGGTGIVNIQPDGGLLINPALTGSVDNVTIGASAPRSGSFTTLTSTGVTTLNGTTIPSGTVLVDTISAQAVSNKTLYDAKFPDADLNNFYSIKGSSLAGNYDATLPVLTGNDTFVFANATQTLVNKTLNSATLIGTVTAGGAVGTAGQLLESTGTGVRWVTASATGITSISIASANGLAGTSSGGSTPALTLSTSVTGVLKGNGTAISAAVSGTDYAPATSGASILKGNGAGGFSSAIAGTDYAVPTTGTNAQLLANNGSGGFSNVTVGSGLTYAAGTLSATSGGGGTVTNVSVISANGFAGTVATSTTTPAITLSTSVTGLLKGNGTAVSAAVSGTDYAPATSGTSILYGNGSGGFSNVTVGSGLSFTAGTLASTSSGGSVTSVSGTGTVSGITLSGTVTTSGSLTLGGTLDLSSYNAAGAFTTLAISNAISLTGSAGTAGQVLTSAGAGAAPTWTSNGSGTVTTVSVVTANGLAGTVANASTTPAITLTTSVTGVLKGNGTAISAAVAGTDYVAPGTTTNFTAQQYFGNATLTDAATIAWNAAAAQVATFTFVSSNRTMGAPSNLVNGAFYAIAVIQNAGSNTLTWNSVFKFPSGTAPTLSTAAGAKDYFTFRSDGTNMFLQGSSLGVA